MQKPRNDAGFSGVEVGSLQVEFPVRSQKCLHGGNSESLVIEIGQ